MMMMMIITITRRKLVIYIYICNLMNVNILGGIGNRVNGLPIE